MALFRRKAPVDGAQDDPGMIRDTGYMLPTQAAMPGLGELYADREDIETSVISKEVLEEAVHTLRRYKDGKANLERRIIEDEQWWKLRHWDYIRERGTTKLQTKSAWLVNVILSKHADAMDALPEPSFLPREAGDEPEAKALSSIVPTILERNDFEAVWSANWWKKLKSGLAIYGVFWDGTKLGGLGDIAIRKIDPLNLFWQPGVQDIQHSRNVFHVELHDNAELEEAYPQLSGKLGGKNVTTSKYLYDDNVDTSDKTPVIDWYYKRRYAGRSVLHYVKFVGETVLYATEDETEPDPMTGESIASRGLYDHGLYPFFIDTMFPEEGTPAGFGYIDLCKDPQRQIDLMNDAIIANCIAAATPRWLKRGDDGVNEEEFADWTRPIVHVQGSIEDNALRQISVNPLSGNYLSILVSKIDEMKETSGNRDVNNGGAPTGVTAASAIAAMQEQSGKLSRDQIKQSYLCYRSMIYCVIELIRQFYDVARMFRIVGDDGLAMYVAYNNANLRLQPQSDVNGAQLAPRKPVFDIDVEAAKASAYSKLSYNELAIQLLQLGFFNPAMGDQALMALDMMDFKGREELRMKIMQNMLAYQQAAAMMGAAPAAPAADGEAKSPGGTDALGREAQKNVLVEKAQARAAASTQPR